MGSGERKDSSFTPKLPLLSSVSASYSHYYMHSPERSGMSTPPLHALASVPFRWEEQPGKPKPTTSFSDNDFVPKCLELPPRLLLDNIAKINSPTTVLEGPYMAGRARTQSSSSSFRMGSECYGSFRAITGSCSPEMVMVVSKKGYKEKGFLGSWKSRGLKSSRREVSGNSCIFPSNSGDRDVEYYSRELGKGNNGSSSFRITRIKREGSFSSLAHSKSHFWASIYEGLKQVMPPWSTREKKNGFMG